VARAGRGSRGVGVAIYAQLRGNDKYFLIECQVDEVNIK